MLHTYVGRLETGQDFVAAHTLIPVEQLRVGTVIDALSPAYGPGAARPNKFGWIVRPLASDVTLTKAEQLLSNTAGQDEVRYMGTVTTGQMTEVLGKDGYKNVFSAPTADTAELSTAN